ncbi:hypothetical protein BABINDRAFT_160478 [Babjeviella inositovora NRRL Y-12698]|uniref:Pantoate--beta-alanine ligase n=1 Tax=Babjeviella inositovora NRRL Y-12698 TaxID=984486 RepID=A0A1E3QVG5_9ASCO|nr:uncharacterized protein BABINDRAFT_160478 [Babjeviella inositovora NRRL Y-12698]ODQ81062.1 hypothetical protein BABINDRAFT_160478 [Babjeviella inositovora NRRL Y-12698]
MQIFRTIAEVREWRRQCVLNNETVGFVATMGALHAGHLSLVTASLAANDRTIVSIFVNPSQFAPHEDLDAYPRNIDDDIGLLGTLDGTVDCVFAPKVSEMYPSGITLEVSQQKGAFVSVLGLSEPLEGVTRPHFFRGVATVVTKLFNIVTPTRAYFGQKDIQQTIVIKRMVKDLLLPVEVVVAPTVRGSSGLALSSRNEYLSDKTRDLSAVIYNALSVVKTEYETGVTEAEPLLAAFKDTILPYLDGTAASFEIEYVSLNDPETLEALTKIDPKVGAVFSTAVKVPKADGSAARLIDNLVFEPKD